MACSVVNNISMHPAVSVVLPVYNAEMYVGEAIKSILGQTFSDLELIVINDGSTDNSLDILQEFSGKDSRIKLVSRENQGLVATLNEGIRIADGRWIARMDADDISLPNRLERQVTWLERKGIDICGSWVECFGERSTIWRYPISHEGCEAQLLFDVPFAHPTVVARAEVFRKLAYDKRYVCAQDYDLWQRAWVAGFKLGNVPEPLLRYRMHTGQVSAKDKVQRKLAQETRCRHWRAMVPDHVLSQGVCEVISVMAGDDGQLPLIVPVLEHLKGRYSEEAQQIIIFNAFRLFCRVAASNQAPWRLWSNFAGSTKGGGKALALAFLRIFRIRPDSVLFEKIKRLYLG